MTRITAMAFPFQKVLDTVLRACAVESGRMPPVNTVEEQFLLHAKAMTHDYWREARCEMGHGTAKKFGNLVFLDYPGSCVKMCGHGKRIERNPWEGQVCWRTKIRKFQSQTQVPDGQKWCPEGQNARRFSHAEPRPRTDKKPSTPPLACHRPYELPRPLVIRAVPAGGNEAEVKNSFIAAIKTYFCAHILPAWVSWCLEPPRRSINQVAVFFSEKPSGEGVQDSFAAVDWEPKIRQGQDESSTFEDLPNSANESITISYSWMFYVRGMTAGCGHERSSVKRWAVEIRGLAPASDFSAHRGISLLTTQYYRAAYMCTPPTKTPKNKNNWATEAAVSPGVRQKARLPPFHPVGRQHHGRKNSARICHFSWITREVVWKSQSSTRNTISVQSKDNTTRATTRLVSLSATLWGSKVYLNLVSQLCNTLTVGGRSVSGRLALSVSRNV
ncbi:hypothetical protein C8J57DRAFT_1238227 [Mycena rebaudengoi]|nr:hypothetical protein C8J57DRAFT_1238227 [Mycena rebaudengoi]